MKFYELSRQERLASLREGGQLTAESYTYLLEKPALNESILNAMVENSIGQFNLPFGIADHFLIDGQVYFVPMVTEEPSVIAAASNGAKRVASSGGFTTVASEHLLKAQVIIHGVTNHDELTKRLTNAEAAIKRVAISARPSLVRRGGGVRQIEYNQLPEGYEELALWIDPVDAFGANMANTIAEAVAKYLQVAVLQDDERILTAILSNTGEKMTVTIECAVNWSQLATDQLSGEEVATRIAELNHFSTLNPDRAVTENKGILNGVFAVALATGNDLRAISASVSHYLQTTSTPVLSQWQLDHEQQLLRGSLTLPLPIGSVGGAINSLPATQISLELLHNPSAKDLMSIIASVGLTNNLAALRALVTNGIQAGHMHLQTANLAIQAGATGDEIEVLHEKLNQVSQADLTLAKKLLQQLRNEG
ncbi:hydroxymethylglutaryl-CoA reductase, degradative [Lapidilactobacillus mulanensis]|uniref:3-hydroxy-3-methylglutaryl coenzyme A reductase n=1 Tax=Lapidilactobacillus mulanensis TaxID=2485999 RepID=A0ABW4DQT3_9LACO|nr:hydroxymethylglutaryl-CoA reductase, degradative [Lapidilactobacillus mulanensis]